MKQEKQVKNWEDIPLQTNHHVPISQKPKCKEQNKDVVANMS